MNKKLVVAFILNLIVSLFINAQGLVKYIDPMIGTDGHGHTFPGATVPFGMVQLSPDTGIEGWDWCSGYHYSDSSIIGFSHTHLSGTGAADYGDILIMPTNGDLKLLPGTKISPDQGYRSRFSHENENSSAGYYSVLLEDYEILAELTATKRVGFHRYTFPNDQNSNIIIDLEHGISDQTTEAYIKIVGDNTIEGFRRSSGWANNHITYFVAEFSRAFNSFGLVKDQKIIKNLNELSGERIKAFVNYHTSDNEEIMIKVGLSAVSIDGARKNLSHELSHWDFDKVVNEATDLWESNVNKIQVEGGSIEQKRIFYTALYHTMIHPNLYNDVDGNYRGMDNKIHNSGEDDYYTVFSLWDTYRALHPLYTLINPNLNQEFIRSLIRKYEEGGQLPIWELASNETGTMIGNHSIPVIVDSYNKGLRNFNIQKAFEAMLYSLESEKFGMASYNKLGYVAANLENQSVSRTLEYAYDDWCFSELANNLDKDLEFQDYSIRSRNYINLFDGNTKFMRGKNVDGNWVPFFNPFEVTKEYTEANAWQYSFYVPHDISGLSQLHGGKNELIKMLDLTFNADSGLEGKLLPDITGFVGQYVHGNEPSHHMAYLYSYLGEPFRTQKWVRYIVNNMYSDQPDGLSGNEDCGQMSAWYIFSAMGFYPVTPGTNQYILGSPLFDKITLIINDSTKFIYNAENISPQNYYISEFYLNGNKYENNFLTHEDIIKGAKVNVIMTNDTSSIDNSISYKAPYSLTKDPIVSPPFILDQLLFFDTTKIVELGCLTKEAEIRYTLDGTEPNQNSKLYTSPILIENSLVLKAIAIYNNKFSKKLISNLSKLEYRNSDLVNNLKNGVKYSYYEGKFISALELLDQLPKKNGYLEKISLEPAEIEDFYGFIFEFYLKVKEDNIYRFFTKSDDGSILLIDDNIIVNNDGSHGTQEASGIAALKKGYHNIKLLYFEDYEGNNIEISMSKFGEKKKEVSPSVLFYIDEK